MTTAKGLLTNIYQSTEIKDVVKRIKPEHLQEDILQHTFLELFQKDEGAILELHSRGKLRAYIVKILYNTATYTRTTFAKQLGRETPTDFCSESKYEVIRFEDETKEAAENYREVECAVCSLGTTSSGFGYKENLLREYAELGTYQAVADKTGIPLATVYKTIREARKEIKRKL